MEKTLLGLFIFINEKFGKYFVSRKAATSKTAKPVLKLLNLLGILTYEENPDKEKFFKRSFIFFEEAQRRGLRIQAVKFLGTYIETFRLDYNNDVYYFDTHPLDVFNKKLLSLDKKQTREVFQKNNIPTPKGGTYKTFFSLKRDFGKKFDFPLIIKPNSGSLSHHITTDIRNYESLKKAIKIVKKYRPDFIAEEFIPGKLFRATVVNDKHVFVCQKDKPNVVGDGISSIYELIQQKNDNPFRGETSQKNTTLHKIPVNSILEENLKQQDLSLDTIIPKNKKVDLLDKYILSLGCDIIDVTPQVNEENMEMFRKTSSLVEGKIIGIDFIAEDISKSFEQQECGVIEINELPYMDMHKFPVYGKSYNVEKCVWDEFFDLTYSDKSL